MARKGYPQGNFNEVSSRVNHLQDKCNFDQFMDDDSNDIIVIMKDNENQSVTMKKVRRCKVCLKIPDSNCICKQKSCTLQSNMSGISEISNYSSKNHRKGRQKVKLIETAGIKDSSYRILLKTPVEVAVLGNFWMS